MLRREVWEGGLRPGSMESPPAVGVQIGQVIEEVRQTRVGQGPGQSLFHFPRFRWCRVDDHNRWIVFLKRLVPDPPRADLLIICTEQEGVCSSHHILGMPQDKRTPLCQIGALPPSLVEGTQGRWQSEAKLLLSCL